MGKKDTRTPQERRAQRKRLQEIMQQTGLEVNSVGDVQELFKEMVAMTLENGLEGELEEELGYSKYDYRNKDTDNSRNGHTEKTLKGIRRVIIRISRFSPISLTRKIFEFSKKMVSI